MESVDNLQEAKKIIDDVIHDLRGLCISNENLRMIIYRLVKKHGNSIFEGEIDDKTAKAVESSKVFISEGFEVRFSELDFFCRTEHKEGGERCAECCGGSEGCLYK